MGKWKQSELMMVKNIELTNREVCELVNRSYNAIKIKRRELGIRTHKRTLNSWTQKEIKFIKQNKHLSDEELAKNLSRSLRAIANKRSKLNISSEPKTWDEEETSFLVNNYKILSIAEISKHLGRTPSAVHTYAYRLKITKKYDYWTKEELATLNDNFNEPLEELLIMISRKSKSQIRHKKRQIINKKKNNSFDSFFLNLPLSHSQRGASLRG